MNTIEKINGAFKGNSFEPFIRHIRFPYFKNLTPGLKINFSFPITALVGPNGSNKSSVLRAIACCPHYENLGDYWFATDVDPIDEDGGRPRYIFGYIDTHSKKTAEVIQTRILRADKPEYWEPSRPLVADGMERLPPLPPGKKVPGRSSTRWSGIQKKVMILDFRSEISAFDKILYHGGMAENLRGKKTKEILRSRSKLLRTVIRENLKSYKPFKRKKETVFLNELLQKNLVVKISDIIGKEYSEIRLIEHSLFENKSYTVILKSKDITYSEAFAGSGEFAAVMIVWKIMNAPERSLIVLDEPEVSLHPGAQIKLMDFLIDECLTKKHQIFIGTHSKLIVEKLPPEAITLLQMNPATSKITVQEKVKPTEAFFHLGQIPANRNKIFVEDPLACEIVKKALRTLGNGAFSQFEVLWYPGGAGSIFGKCMPGLFQTNEKRSYFLLDGDKKPKVEIIHPDQIPENDYKKTKQQITLLSGINKIDFALNGGNDKNLEAHLNIIERGFLKYALERTHFLPSMTPEDFIWECMHKDAETNKLEALPIKDRYAKLTRQEKGLMDDEIVSASEILETQIRRLASINDGNKSIIELAEYLKKLVD